MPRSELKLVPGSAGTNEKPLTQTERTDNIKDGRRKVGWRECGKDWGAGGGNLADQSRRAGEAAEKGPLHRAYGVQRAEGEEEEAQGGEGTRAPRPLPWLTPRVGPEGHGPVALHQVRSLEAVFVLETPMWLRAWGARGAGSCRVASHAVAPDETTERQQQSAEQRPSSGPGTPLPGSRHLGFWETGGRRKEVGAGAAAGQQGAP